LTQSEDPRISRRPATIAGTIMARRIWQVVAVATALGVFTAEGRSETPREPELSRLKAHVETLASRAFAGRKEEGSKKAADYVEAALRGAGLEPLFDGQYTQPIAGREPNEVIGRNVGARLIGSDPKLKDEWVILAAHFDHLGQFGDLYFPGADDNASGTAMLLEAARCFAGADALKSRRSIMFVGFDLEEAGLFGSRYFAQHPPVPLEKVSLFLTADMIGRSLGGVCKEYVFVLGTERIPGVREWIDGSSKELPIKVGMVGTDILGIDRSDYGPFRIRKVPYLFFSTGENPTYHQPTDVASTLDYPKLTAISRLILGVVIRAANADAVPTWSPTPDYQVGEAVVLRDIFQCLLDHKEDLKIRPATAVLMRGSLRTIDGVIDRGKITPSERSGILRVAQLVLISVL
jgi:hypothetical protein